MTLVAYQHNGIGRTDKEDNIEARGTHKNTRDSVVMTNLRIKT